jgi:hypothetical protein
LGGLPANAPERPADAYLYPAIHDMPPTRATPTLNEAQQKRVEDELAAARDRQRGPAGQAPKKQAPKPAAAGSS